MLGLYGVSSLPILSAGKTSGQISARIVYESAPAASPTAKARKPSLAKKRKTAKRNKTKSKAPTKKAQTKAKSNKPQRSSTSNHQAAGAQQAVGQSGSRLGWRKIKRQAFPLPEFRQSPHYPELARRLEIEGSVHVAVHVKKDGRVRNVKVLRGLGYGTDEATVAAIRKWKFEPAIDVVGNPVDSLFEHQVIFELEG